MSLWHDVSTACCSCLQGLSENFQQTFFTKSLAISKSTSQDPKSHSLRNSEGSHSLMEPQKTETLVKLPPGKEHPRLVFQGGWLTWSVYRGLTTTTNKTVNLCLSDTSFHVESEQTTAYVPLVAYLTTLSSHMFLSRASASSEQRWCDRHNPKDKGEQAGERWWRWWQWKWATKQPRDQENPRR